MLPLLQLTTVAVLFLAAEMAAAADNATGTPSANTNAPSAAAAADDWAPYEHWITGDIFIEDGVLLFRTDKPVKGNPRKDVVMLGTTKAAIGLLPIYTHAAETHKKFRLFGALLPYADTIKSHSGPLPNVQFITWKMHLPGDPDVLPAGQKIEFNGQQATIDGKKVTLEDDKHHDVEADSHLDIHQNGQDSNGTTPAKP